MRRLVAAALALSLLATPAIAANPSEMLDDPELEQRARALGKELRCLVCQNESIDDSQAEVARDLRLLVRERIVAGDTDQEVLDYLVDRYGAFVRFRPPFTAQTALLWIAPFVVVLIAAGGAAAYLKGRRKVAVTAALSPEEEEALAQLLKEREGR